MTFIGRVSRLVLCYIWLVTVQGFECPYQECFCAGPDIICDDRRMIALPHLMFENNSFFTFLVLDDNLINTIQDHSLPSNLTDISFTKNPITSIGNSAFDASASTLESLSFSDAHLTRLSDTFINLRALRYLNIFNSTIEDWNIDAMKNIGITLQTLSLENVGLTSWPTWIQYFSQISELSITGSTILSMPDDALDTLANTLSSLTLTNNMFTDVPKTLSKMLALKMLSLEQNRIVDITWLPKNSNLMSLSLTHNNIPDGGQLHDALQPYANTLHDLELSDNKLTSIPNISFLTHVGSLNLTSNLISNPNSGSLPLALFKLELGFNYLASIPTILFELTSLTDAVFPLNSIKQIRDVDIPAWTSLLELGFNLITELTDTSFPKESKIQFLRLNNNPISQISTNAFVNVPSLVELDLRYSKLTRLPLALSFLKGIVMLDVSGTGGLICTCLEKGLSTWIVSQSSGNIIGNCGKMSVYDFFATLSPYCPG